MKKKFYEQTWFHILIAVVLVVGADYFLNFSTLNISGKFNDDEVVQVENSSQQTESNSQDKNVIETDEFKLTFTDMWIEEARYHDGEIVAIEYQIENKTNEPISNDFTLLNVLFDVYQDNNPNTIENLPYEGTDKYGIDEMHKVKPGGTSTYGMGYVLDDRETPVTIVVKEVIGDEIYRQSFDIKDLEMR